MKIHAEDFYVKEFPDAIYVTIDNDGASTFRDVIELARHPVVERNLQINSMTHEDDYGNIRHGDGGWRAYTFGDFLFKKSTKSKDNSPVKLLALGPYPDKRRVNEALEKGIAANPCGM
ncbi:hypothetical protein HY642_02055 [Candidatus Woesearchaeota archaeon]|nr:hypothetical protein [Candidatus Woesearchaeota archaeon]